MLAILVDEISSRSAYTFDIVLKRLLGLSYICFDNKADFLNAPHCKLNYSSKELGGIPSIHPHSLLFSSDISDQQLVLATFEELPVFFPQPINENHLLPFDVFACCFYLLSRYEEYLPHPKDALGRFRPEDSLAYQHGFLNKAIVHRWANELSAALKTIYTDIDIHPPAFSFLPTLDIDNAYAYHGKGVFRGLAGFCRDILTLNHSGLLKRLKAIKSPEADPYNSYAFVKKIHQQFKSKPLIFWLLGDYARLDKNLPHSSKVMKNLIKESMTYSLPGIHPSAAAENKKRISTEKARLAQITGMNINQSRMHYLKFQLPDTFESLIQAGIEKEYSMGYSEMPGFRAGMAVSFPFFNLRSNQTTDLIIYPFQIMDASFLYHQQKKPADALVEIKEIIDEVKEMGGQLITVFHNECLGTEARFKGWRELYIEMLEYIHKN